MTEATVGSWRDPSSVRRLRFDDVVLTYVTDGDMFLSTRAFFPRFPASFWDAERPGTVGFAIHVGDQPFGVVERAGGERRWVPLASEVLGRFTG